MKNNINIGKIGEDIAFEYLKERGYKLIKRNFKTKFDEIDIIGVDKEGTLIFFEVKTMYKNYADKIVNPENNFTSFKKKKIGRVCELFCIKHPNLIKNNGWRIDLLAIILNKGGLFELRHYKNV